jgi:hypothetical protein
MPIPTALLRRVLKYVFIANENDAVVNPIPIAMKLEQTLRQYYQNNHIP